MSKLIEEILTPKPDARPRIYAYSITDGAHKGLLKVGQTSRDVKMRVAEQLRTAAIKNYTIELDETAECEDGAICTDHDVRGALRRKGFKNAELEWVRCSVADVKTALAELRTGQRFGGSHNETFGLRDEQAAAVEKTHDYYRSIWREDANAAPRFLWNAKMRFGKTFTAYHLAKKIAAHRGRKSHGQGSKQSPGLKASHAGFIKGFHACSGWFTRARTQPCAGRDHSWHSHGRA